MKDILTYNNPKSEIVKRYIDLKDSIVSLRNRDLKTIMITSTNESIQHAELAANLAVAISKNGYNTLIIDCDIENGILGKVFGINKEFGLSDYIFDNKRLIEIINDTELDSLKVIATGEKSIDIIGRRGVQTLLEDVKKDYDYIIINGPTVLNGNGTQVLAQYCDGIIVAVEHEKTKIEYVKKLQSKLENYKDKILGVVLNNYNCY